MDGVIQVILLVLLSETLLHILLSSEYSGFHQSSMAVDTVIVPVLASSGSHG